MWWYSPEESCWLPSHCSRQAAAHLFLRRLQPAVCRVDVLVQVIQHAALGAIAVMVFACGVCVRQVSHYWGCRRRAVSTSASSSSSMRPWEDIVMRLHKSGTASGRRNKTGAVHLQQAFGACAPALQAARFDVVPAPPHLALQLRSSCSHASSAPHAPAAFCYSAHSAALKTNGTQRTPPRRTWLSSSSCIVSPTRPSRVTACSMSSSSLSCCLRYEIKGMHAPHVS